MGKRCCDYFHADTVIAGTRRTDGTDESDFFPPIHPINEPPPLRHTTLAFPSQSSSSHYNKTSADTGSLSLPSQPLPIYQQHGMDGHHSRNEIDHPDDRPRARHYCSSLSSNSNYTAHHDTDTTRSYHSGPSVESGSATNSSRSSS
jgi:aquaporin related protein